MATLERLFGTDGIRGRANEYPLTPEMAAAFGRAVAQVFGRGRSHPVLIGRDTRISGPMLEQAVASGVAAMGVDVRFLGVLPTPAIALLTRELGACAGIVISASHNPYEDNGLKIFQANGTKCDDASELEIERLMQGDELARHGVDGAKIGSITGWPEAAARYIELALAQFGAGLDLRGWRVVVDGANGAAYETTPAVLRRLGAEVIPLHLAPNGININAGCGSTHPEAMQAAVRRHGAQIGLAHDGDADRLICCDETGALLDGDEMLALLGLEYLRRGTLAKKTLVATVMSNLGLDECLTRAGGRVIRAGVGDRQVLEQMQAHGLNLGGEQSGHMILWDYNRTGDGLVTALELLRLLHARQEPLSRLRGCLRKYPQRMVNLKVGEKTPLDRIPGLAETVAAVEAELGSGGRVLLRYSGTEAKIRVLIETRDEAQLQPVLAQVLAPLQRHFGLSPTESL